MSWRSRAVRGGLGAFLALGCAVGALDASPPAPPHRLPDVVRFHVATSKAPDAAGRFGGSILVESAFPLVGSLVLTPTEGIVVTTGGDPRQLRLVPGEPRTVDFAGTLEPGAPRPAGINVKLRYRTPVQALRAYVKQDPRGEYRDAALRDATLEYLNGLRASTAAAVELNRGLVFE